MDDLSLVFPTKDHESKAFEYIKEFREHNTDTNGMGGEYRLIHIFFLDNQTLK
ncbi:MAG TPA: hypothetical protein VFD33_02270 [Bacillota bacterium]|nr:hypothetical protein [Bacillota bacterium]